jgi:hypothetical protein
LLAKIPEEGEVKEDPGRTLIGGSTIDDDKRGEAAFEIEHRLIVEQIWARFDLFFGIFVLLNGASIGAGAKSPYEQSATPVGRMMMGSNLTNSSNVTNVTAAAEIWIPGAELSPVSIEDIVAVSTYASGWTLKQFELLGGSLERFFLAVFSLEWIMRLMLHYQLEYSYNYEQILGIFPPPDEVQWIRLLVILPEFMDPRRDAWVLFDFGLVMMAFGDELFTYLYSSSEARYDAKLSHVLVIRVFRVFRLFRLVRVLRLMRSLKLLVDGMLVSIRILSYSLLLLGLALFTFTVIAFEMMKDLDGRETYRFEEMPEYFSTLLRGILTMYQITTFVDWTALYREVTDVHGDWSKLLIIGMLTTGGLGLMNLTVGVMVESAFRLARRERAKHADQALIPLRIKLKELGTGVVGKALGSRSLGSILTQTNMGSSAYNLKKRVKWLNKKFCRTCCCCCHRRSDEEKQAQMDLLRKEADTSDAILDIENITEVMNYDGDVFEERMMYQLEMHLALKEVDLDWKRVWSTLSKLDCEQKGKVRLNELMDCLSRGRRSADGLDVASARGTFRRLTRKSRALDYMSEDLGNALKTVLHRLADRDDVANRRAARDALLERKKHLMEYMDIRLDVIPRDIKTLRMLLRSVDNIEKETIEHQAKRHSVSLEDLQGNSNGVSVNIEDATRPTILFESEASRAKRMTSNEASRKIFAMDDD